jgi:hypothetical protein
MSEIICPSGLKGRVRGLRVKDEELFTDKKLVRSNRVITSLMARCWEETLDPGPYQQSDPLDWDLISSSDRIFALIQIRVASYGEDYEFRVTCSNSMCEHGYAWGVNLNELDVAEMSERGRQHLKTGDLIPVKLSNGLEVKCRLPNGEDETFMATLEARDDSRALTLHLARRVAEIEGEKHWDDVVKKVEELPAIVGDELWDITDEIEGGVEMAFDVQCPQCSNVQQVILPFEAGFFSNRKRFARSRRRRSS